ncbi:palmitoyltransferase ZDHHC4-like [Saccoglossus kowalevskii]|uniref:Palmitoyltransferase n=1 Tax=Saccoglossus kowalevskii TaxID=10224 RepID=A0ABM0MAE8_SACKO|nr:PREDICTED: probable palmitoyltransferase ZDHHC4-like [Saccoglossus kowalevskii]
MDFLTLVIIYSIAFAIFAYIFFLGDSSYHQHGIVGNLRTAIINFIIWWPEHCLPTPLYRMCKRQLEYVLYTRNCCMQVLYISLVAIIYLELTVEIMPLAVNYKFGFRTIALPYILAIINTYYFVRCCHGNPGVITEANHENFHKVYAYDGVLYKPNVNCKTCKFIKPARSKHCALCDHCVHRFDHHCSWVNNCIGGYNVYYFLAYLLTIILGCLSISYVAAWYLKYVTLLSGLQNAQYIGEDSQPHPVTRSIIFQHLFLQYPRVVFLMTSLLLLSLILGVFTSYHIILMLTNQTTNERWKKLPYEVEQKRKQTRLLYSKGIIGNTAEVVYPICRKRKKS